MPFTHLVICRSLQPSQELQFQKLFIWPLLNKKSMNFQVPVIAAIATKMKLKRAEKRLNLTWGKQLHTEQYMVQAIEGREVQGSEIIMSKHCQVG